MIHTDFSNSTDTTERSLREQAQADRLPSMTFSPYEPPITVIVGDWAVTLYFCPAIFVQSPAGEREFSSRLEADLYMASEIRRLRYLAGFDGYCNGKPEPEDKDEGRGWRSALHAEAQAQPAIEEDYDFIRRGGAGGPF